MRSSTQWAIAVTAVALAAFPAVFVQAQSGSDIENPNPAKAAIAESVTKAPVDRKDFATE